MPWRLSASPDGGQNMRTRIRALPVALLLTFLTASPGSSQDAQLARIPMPLPFPQGSSVFQWDYECIAQRACGFTGLGLERFSVKSASIVLANFKVGEMEIPTYFVWGILIDGSSIAGMTQDPFSAGFRVVNMRLIAAGSPGL